MSDISEFDSQRPHEGAKCFCVSKNLQMRSICLVINMQFFQILSASTFLFVSSKSLTEKNWKKNIFKLYLSYTVMNFLQFQCGWWGI